MAHLYFSEHLESEHESGLIEVRGDEARHAVKVSRLRVGEEILVGDGEGRIARGLVTETGTDAFTVNVAEVSQTPETSPRVWIVQALAKGDRSERAVELCTEFGAHGFIPWQAERSISRWDSSKAIKGVEKWRRIAREASKQSIRAFIPRVQDLHTTEQLCALAANPHHAVVVLHPRDARNLSEVVSEITASDVYVCVGPEGGLSTAELQRLQESGAHIAVVGSEVLRTSSAGAAALSVMNLATGRW